MNDEKPDIVVVVGADHVYRMDFSQMVDQHIDSGAACTVAAIRQPISLADQFGVIDVKPDDPSAIREFLEKPKDPRGLPDSPHEVLASMGNYVFDADALVEAVTQDATLHGSKHDMGGDIVPAFVRRGAAGVYDFKDNDVPGSTDRDRGYWRDVGTMASYYAAHMDVVSPLPIFNLYNFDWPIYTSYGPQPPVKVGQGADGQPSRTDEAAAVAGGRHHRRYGQPLGALARGAGRPRRDRRRTRCCINGVHVGAGAVVRNAIVDKGVDIPAGSRIGVDQEPTGPGASWSRTD